MSTAPPTLTPSSTVSVSILPSTGSITAVAATLPFGIYAATDSPLYSTDFLSGSVDQVSYVFKKLGGDVLDIELTPGNVYAAYEEAVLEYSYIINSHQARNILSNVLGNTTGTFDHDGNIKSGSLSSSLGATHVGLKYPKFDFSYARKVSDGISSEVNIGGSERVYSASFSASAGVQDYDLQSLISASSATSGFDFSGLVGNTKILIKKVYYKTPHAMWRFFGFYGGLNVVGNLASYGQYSDDSTFQVVPVWQNRLQAMAYEDAIHVRNSHYSYQLKNNRLRLFPVPYIGGPSKFWIEFSIPGDAWTEDATRDSGLHGINNYNTLPFGNIPYDSINSMGKVWIRKFALSSCKEILGLIRSKFGNTVPIPGNTVNLNGSELIAQSKEEKEQMREELKKWLDELTYEKLAESDKNLLESTTATNSKIPAGIYVG